MRILTRDESSKAPGSRPAKRGNNLAPAARGTPWLELHQTLGNQGVQRLLSARHIQAKLRVGQPTDPYEQEADQVADRVMRMPEPQLQRARACGGGCPKCRSQQPGQEHAHLQAKRVGSGDMGQSTAPPAVNEVLSSPGQPLDPATRAFMEPRFGHEFSRVRVHSGGAAEQSAREVNASAYTVGHNIVFSDGRFNPKTTEGRHLLAHELAHVLQQNQGPRQLQRWATCKPARLQLSLDQPDCPPREPGERHRARTGPMVVGQIWVPISNEDGIVIGNFDISKPAIKSSLHRTIEWKKYLERITASRSHLKILGFTDCQGDDGRNEALRNERAAAVFNILPAAVQPHVSAYEGAPMHDCVTENDNAADRALNRSAVLIIEYAEADIEEEELTASLAKNEPPTQSCSKDQRDRLAVVFPVAEEMIRNAMRVINRMKKGSDEEILLMKYFGKDAFSHASHIRKGFQDTLRQWQKAGPTYPYVCVKQGAGECTVNALGYVEAFGLPGWPWGSKGDIHICEEAFALKNDLHLAAALIHETSHRLDWTTTDVYCGMETNRGCPPSLSTKEAEDNADSYAQFAREAFEQWG